MHPDLQALDDQLDATLRDAEAVASGLGEERGCWRPQPSSWSVAECLEHLTSTNRIYLGAMEPAALHARQHGRRRRGPAAPGFIGRLFVRNLEPPVKFKSRAPSVICPLTSCSLTEALATFVASQSDVRAFLRTFADIDLSGVRFRNPFIRRLNFSLATGLHAIPAHERRHLWQAWNVRRLAEDHSQP